MSRSKQQRQVLHSRSFWGEDTASVLIDWLNRRDKPKNDPVQRLIDLNSNREIDFSNPDPRHTIVELINDTARRWQISLVPVAAMTSHGWNADWRHVPTRKAHPLQLLAFVKALHLATQNLLRQVLPCAREKCPKYFFARFSHQEFCSSNCQRLHFRSTPEWRKSRAEYMKRLRAETKRRDLRNLSRAKGKKR